MANPTSGRSQVLPPLYENVELPTSGIPLPPVNRHLKPRKTDSASGTAAHQAMVITNAAFSLETSQTSDAENHANTPIGEKTSSSHGVKLKTLFKFFGFAKEKKKETAEIPKPVTQSQAAVATLEACLPRIMNMTNFFEIQGILRTAASPNYQKSAENDLIAFLDEMGTNPNDESCKALGFALKKLVKQSFDLEEKVVLAITAGVTVDFLEQYTDAGTLASKIYTKLQTGEINSEAKCPRKLVDLAKLCQKIAQNEDLNLMGWANLGIIFGPNIFPELTPRSGMDLKGLQKQLNHFARMLLESWSVNTQTSNELSPTHFTANIRQFRNSMRRSVHAAIANPRDQFDDHIYDTVADLEDNSAPIDDAYDDSDFEEIDVPQPSNKAPIPKPRTTKSLGCTAIACAPEPMPRARAILVPLQTAVATRQTQKFVKQTAAKPVVSFTEENRAEQPEQLTFAARRGFFEKR